MATRPRIEVGVHDDGRKHRLHGYDPLPSERPHRGQLPRRYRRTCVGLLDCWRPYQQPQDRTSLTASHGKHAPRGERHSAVGSPPITLGAARSHRPSRRARNPSYLVHGVVKDTMICLLSRISVRRLLARRHRSQGRKCPAGSRAYGTRGATRVPIGRSRTGLPGGLRLQGSPCRRQSPGRSGQDPGHAQTRACRRGRRGSLRPP